MEIQLLILKQEIILKNHYELRNITFSLETSEIGLKHHDDSNNVSLSAMFPS